VFVWWHVEYMGQGRIYLPDREAGNRPELG